MVLAILETVLRRFGVLWWFFRWVRLFRRFWFLGRFDHRRLNGRLRFVRRFNNHWRLYWWHRRLNHRQQRWRLWNDRRDDNGRHDNHRRLNNHGQTALILAKTIRETLKHSLRARLRHWSLLNHKLLIVHRQIRRHGGHSH
jgi:hypothetical protein